MAKAENAQTLKLALLADLAAARQAVLTAASTVPSGCEDEAFLDAWSVRDLLAHLIGWDYANRQAAEAVQAGRQPDFYSLIDRDWHTYNSRLVSEYKRGNLSDLIAVARLTHQELLAYLEKLPAEAFRHDYGVRFRGYRVTIERLLRSELGDEHEHARQIENWLQGPNPTSIK